MLRDLEHEAVAVIVGFERRQDRRKLILERDVDDRADHLADAADIVGGRLGRRGLRLGRGRLRRGRGRSEEHTSELQSLMRISYAVFCLKKKTQNTSAYPYHNS